MPLLMCPNCNASMNEVKRGEVTFDMCPTCRGVWLDRGELEKILEGGRSERQEFSRDREEFYRDPDAYRRSHPDQRRRNDERGERGERGDDDDDRGGGFFGGGRRGGGIFDIFD